MNWSILILAVVLCNVVLAGEWKLVWSDEFDKAGAPDPAKWGYEEGYVRNKEEQYYTKARPENARVEDGMLVIEGRKDNMPNPKYEANATKAPASQPTVPYTSASLTTRGKAS